MTSTRAARMLSAQVDFCTFFYIALVSCSPPVPTFLRQSRFFEPEWQRWRWEGIAINWFYISQLLPACLSLLTDNSWQLISDDHAGHNWMPTWGGWVVFVFVSISVFVFVNEYSFTSAMGYARMVDGALVWLNRLKVGCCLGCCCWKFEWIEFNSINCIISCCCWKFE